MLNSCLIYFAKRALKAQLYYGEHASVFSVSTNKIDNNQVEVVDGQKKEKTS